jgi:hypothetical protein
MNARARSSDDQKEYVHFWTSKDSLVIVAYPLEGASEQASILYLRMRFVNIRFYWKHHFNIKDLLGIQPIQAAAADIVNASLQGKDVLCRQPAVAIGMFSSTIVERGFVL